MTAKILITGLMDKIFSKYFSLSLLAMPALVLTVHKGGGIAGIIVLLTSLIVLIAHYPIDITLSKKEKIFIFSLLLLPVVIAFDVILRGLSLRYLDYYLRLVMAIVVYFALRESRLSLMPLVIGILVGAIGAGILAIYQKYYLNEYYAHGHTLKINFGNISLLLAMMSFTGLLIVSDIRFKKTFYIVTLLAFILGITGSILSGSRGAWLAMPFFMGLFIMYFPIKRKFKISGFIILILAVFTIYHSNSGVKSRIDLAYTNTEAYFSSDKLNSVKTSVGIRLELWKAACMIIAEHPISGIGSGQLKQALKEKIDSGEIKKIELYDHVHNEVLQILVITGITGFIAYITLYTGLAYYFYSSFMTGTTNREKYLSFQGIMIVGAYFIFGLTNYSFGHHVMIVFFAVMVAIFAGMIKSIENELLDSLSSAFHG